LTPRHSRAIGAGAFAAVLALILGFAALFGAARGAEDDKGMIAGLISRALSSNQTNVSIGVVDGALSSDVTVKNIVLSDRDGPWLKIDKARLIWNRLALFQRRVDIDTLDIGDLEFLRRPPKSPPDPNAVAGPILPELPVKIIVKALAVGKLSLGEAVMGTAASLSIAGAASLGPPSEGLDLKLEARRLDAGGAFLAKLNFVPQGAKLSVALDFDEPAGGLIGRIANLPGQPPVKFALDGDGPLDAFHARLQFAAGPDIGADGPIDMTREGAGRRLALDLRSRLAGLLPPMAAPVFAGETALRGSILLGDDGAVGVTTLALASSTARLDVGGARGADGLLDLTIHAGALPGQAAIGKLAFDARLRGPIAGLQIEAALAAEKLRWPGGELATASARFDARPNGLVSDATTRIALEGDAAFTGLALAERARQDMIGGEGRVTFRASAAPDGAVAISDFHLDAASVKASFAGDAGPKRIHGEGLLEAPDLGHFAAEAGRPLRGAARVKFILDGAPDKNAYHAALDGEATRLATGIPSVDGFAEGTLKLSGGASAPNTGGFAFDHLALVGAHGRADIDGSADEAKAAIHAQIDVPEVKFLDSRVGGHAAIVADLSGALTKLDVSARANLAGGRLMGRPAPRLEIAIDAHDAIGKLDARLKIDGEVDAKPATGALHLAKTAEGGWALDGLAFALGSVKLQGAAAISRDLLTEGKLAFEAADLDDLSALALTKLSGGLSGEATLHADAGRQGARIVAKSAAASFGGASIAGLAIDMTASDLFGRARLAGEAALARVVAGGETIGDIKLTCKTEDAASAFEAKATASGFAIETRGRFEAAPVKLALASLTARGKGQTLSLVKPANFAYGPDGLKIDGLEFGVGGGRLAASGTAGARLDLRVSASALPLALANLASPGLGLSGTASAAATLSGAASAPEGDWRFKVDGLDAPALRSTGLGALKIEGSGRLSPGKTSLDATLTAAGGSLRVTGAAPLGADGALDVKAAGRFDLSAANRFLSARGERASGAATIDARITGPIAKPRASGGVTIAKAAFADEARGFKLESIEASIAAKGDEIEIAHFQAATPNGGSLGLEGHVKLDAAAGFPGAFRITGQKAQLISTEIVSASADLAMELSGALARDPLVSGRVDIKSLDIEIPGKMGGALQPLEGARHIEPGETARARLALNAPEKTGFKAAAPFAAKLALTVSAPNRVFLRGRGVDAELGGELKIAGLSTAPRVSGGFDMRRGTLAMLGVQLTFSSGKVVLAGDAMPELDMTAQTTAGDITAYIAVTGPAAKPVFAFTSSPALPQDEILSRVLFQKPTGNLSAFQALQLANAVASLSGGGDVFEKMRKNLGVDSLDVSSNASGGPVVGARRAINDRLSVGVKSGSRPQDNGVTLDLDITRHLRLQGGMDASGGSTAGVGAQYEY
jgi:translocation and assembly module TamB